MNEAFHIREWPRQLQSIFTLLQNQTTYRSHRQVAPKPMHYVGSKTQQNNSQTPLQDQTCHKSFLGRTAYNETGIQAFLLAHSYLHCTAQSQWYLSGKNFWKE